ncbi:MAG: tetratricopeptide repeat protein [Planctomycetota bacterium]
MRSICLTISTLVLLLPLPSPASETPSPLERAKALAVSDNRRARAAALQVLGSLAKPGTARGDEALFRYAELCLRFHAEGERGALTRAKENFARLHEKAGSRWGMRGRVGLLRVAALEGRREEALRGLARVLALNRCERACEAAWYLGCLYAEARDDVKQLRLARQALADALKLHAANARYNPPLVTAAEIRRKLAEVRRRIREIEAGPLKTLFERAERLRRAKKYDEAIAVYAEVLREFPGRDLAALSDLRICECLLGKKNLRAALRRARSFIAEDPLGAYRGHAHQFIGGLLLERLFDVASAESEFRRVLSPDGGPRPYWLKCAHAAVLARRRREKDPPPLSAEPHPSWKEVAHAAHESAGIIEYVRRRFDAAAAHFAESQRLEPVGGCWAGDETAGMAEVAELCRRRKMPLDEALLGQGDERTRLVLFLGSVYMRGWKDRRAMDLFQRVWRNEFGKATLDQRAYARARLGAGHHHFFEYERAMEVYREFESPPLSRSIYAADALLQRAVAVSKTGRPWEAMPLFERCMARYPGTFWGMRAAYNRAFFAYCLENPPVALNWCRLALRSYPRSPWARRCRQWEERLEEKVRKGETKKRWGQ